MENNVKNHTGYRNQEKWSGEVLKLNYKYTIDNIMGCMFERVLDDKEIATDLLNLAIHMIIRNYTNYFDVTPALCANVVSKVVNIMCENRSEQYIFRCAVWRKMHYISQNQRPCALRKSHGRRGVFR